jgi:hypothetical protein
MALASADGYAAEGGIGVYLLGSRGAMAGFQPPPGVYFQNDFIHYRGAFDAARAFPGGGVPNSQARAAIDLLTPAWITPLELLGGHLAFAATFPVARARMTTDLGTSDTDFSFGDPYPQSFIGWHAGNWHWELGVAANIPSGRYRVGALVNVALNRPAADLFGALTWLDPAIGLEVSMFTGVTLNGENRATHYRTGNEFHIEWVVAQHFAQKFWAGLVGYHYQQLTGDSGEGALLGPFKGRVTALGGAVGTTLMLGQTPVAANIRVYREFVTQNRLEGTAAYLTLAMPLYVHGTPAKTVAAKN